ncbi:MAG: ATP-binding protein, partial [Kangiellaceae bacterium]|nr:ATP-binding protein [Kangiellaceae bacterium]
CLVSLTALHSKAKNCVLAIGRDISEIDNAQAALQQQVEYSKRLQEQLEINAKLLEQEKRKFEEFVNLAPVGIAINRFDNGAFEYINQEFARFSGYDVEQLNQMDYWDLTPKKYEANEVEQLEKMKSLGRYGPYEKEYIHKNGTHYPVLLSGIKISDSNGIEYIWSVVQDISRQKQIEQDLKASKQSADESVFRLNLAVESANIGVWELNLITNELIWDERMYQLYGITEQTFGGVFEAWSSGVHPDDIDDASKQLQDAIDGVRRFDPEFRVVWPNGEVRSLKASAEVIRDKTGQPFKVIGVNYDVTEKVKAIEQLANAKQLAEDSVRAKDMFLANMSHEIRTPMNGIYGALQILNQHKQSDQNQELIDKAIYSTKSLLTIINDILDFSKIEAGKLKLEKTEFNLTSLIESIQSDFFATTEAKGVSLSTHVENDIAGLWVGDPVRIRQVLVNLVANAVKFTEQGAISIDASVDSCGSKTDKGIIVKVSDTGIGMSKSELSKLFERFEQADSSTTRKYGGTGLGMSITSSLIELMRGKISVDSSPSKGTTFTLTIPLEQAEINGSKSNKKTSTKSVHLSGKTILVAEDNKINILIIKTMLENSQATIHVANNGKEAIELSETCHPDLILMDIQMPVLDGRDACKVIRKSGFDNPIIAFTANVLTQEVEQYLNEGFDGYLAKPIDIEHLNNLLAEYLG